MTVTVIIYLNTMARLYPFLIIAVFFMSARLSASEVVINGAGATFPYPLYTEWAHQFSKETGSHINYQQVGSGEGIKLIKAKVVDFGASDVPLTAKELKNFDLIQFPITIGGIVPVVNIVGMKKEELKLTPELLASIYLGDIKKWNDKEIKEINPDVKLPDQEITVVHRADGSGTTWIFTNYLSEISTEWRKRVGVSSKVLWPVGIGGVGNEGIVAYVQRINGAIGYVELAHALQNKMTYVLLKNKSGNFVVPSFETFQAAIKDINWGETDNSHLSLMNSEAKSGWPIMGPSYIIINKTAVDKNVSALSFFDWCFSKGEKIAKKLNYVPIPKNVAAEIIDEWRKNR